MYLSFSLSLSLSLYLSLSSWSNCSFSAFISEFDTEHIFRVLSTPTGRYQELTLTRFQGSTKKSISVEGRQCRGRCEFSWETWYKKTFCPDRPKELGTCFSWELTAAQRQNNTGKTTSASDQLRMRIQHRRAYHCWEVNNWEIYLKICREVRNIYLNIWFAISSKYR